MTKWAARVTGVESASGETVSYFFTTGPDPLESSVVRPWMSRIDSPGNFERHAFSRGRVTGGPTVGYGTMTLNGRDGALDTLSLLALDGHPLELWRGGDGATRWPEDFDVYLRGTTAGATFANGIHTLQLRNRQGEIESKETRSSDERYRGDNVLPDGVEGVAGDLKDKLKPIILGVARNFSPPLVNTSRWIFQISSNSAVPIAEGAIDEVRDTGVVIPAGSSHASLSALQAATVTPNTYDWYFGAEGWFFRLGSAPAGTVTCDVTEGAAPADRTTGMLVYRLLLAAGQPAGSIDGLAALNAAVPGEAGLWIGTSETTFGAVIADLLTGPVATWLDDRSGTIQLGALEPPGDTPAATFVADDLLIDANGDGYRILSPGEPGTPIPPSEFVVNHQFNYEVQTGDAIDAANVTEATRSFIGQQWRSLTVENSDNVTGHFLARPATFNSFFASEADAVRLAQRLKELFGRRRFIVEIDVATAGAVGIEVLDTIAVAIPRFDWSGGKRFRVIGIIDDLGDTSTPPVTTLILWG